MARFGNANIMLHSKFYYYYYVEIECVFLLSGMGCYVLNILVPSPLAQALYLARQHYRRTVPTGVDNNRIVLTDIKRLQLLYYNMIIFRSCDL